MRENLLKFIKSEIDINAFVGKASGGGSGSIDEYIQGYKECALVVLSEVLSTLNPFEALVFTEPVYNAINKRYTIDVTFDEKFLQRDSLYAESEGVYDVVTLLENGWHISQDIHVPWGEWHGHQIVAAREHEPIPIIKLITEIFNARYAPDAIAIEK